MLRLAKDIGRAMREKAAPHVFVFRSTLVPGTVEDVLRPIIERESGKKDGVDFHVCFQPEFLREGSSIRDYDKPPFTIVGAQRAQRRSTRCASCSAICPASSITTSIRAAEMVKYCCNNFHALKITFANETARLCEALGVDPFEVMDLVCQDHAAQHLAGVPEARLRVRRLVPAEGPARDDVPRQDARRRPADARRHPAVQPRPHRPRDRQGAGHRASAGSA